VDNELEILIQEGIIKKDENSQWGTPLVPVLKLDGNIRLCADYKGYRGAIQKLIQKRSVYENRGFHMSFHMIPKNRILNTFSYTDKIMSCEKHSHD
jgi:hypothetical protein